MRILSNRKVSESDYYYFLNVCDYILNVACVGVHCVTKSRTKDLFVLLLSYINLTLLCTIQTAVVMKVFRLIKEKYSNHTVEILCTILFYSVKV